MRCTLLHRKLAIVAFLMLANISLALPYWFDECCAEVIPTVNVSPSGTVTVSWQTEHLTAAPTVYYGPVYYQKEAKVVYPDYIMRAGKDTVSTSHNLILGGIKPNLLYHYRISCIDTKRHFQLMSKDYTFRYIIDSNGNAIQTLTITHGPSIAYVTQNSAVIRFETSKPSTAQVEYSWTESFDLRLVALDTTYSYIHEIKLLGLRPGEFYHYKVTAKGVHEIDRIESGEHMFSTAPRNSPFKFAVMGDSRASGASPCRDFRLNGVNTVTLKQLMIKSFQLGAAFIVFTGDLISGGSDDTSDVLLQYDTWKTTVDPISAYIPIYVVFGNHEASTKTEFKSAEAIWAQVFTMPDNGPDNPKGMPPYKETVYSFDYGNSHFVILNCDYASVDGKVDEKQMSWLKKDLVKPKEYTFVFLHEPAYPTGGHVGSGLDRYPKDRDRFWKILDKNGVDMVFVGHEHNYSRTLIDKSVNPNWQNAIWQIVSGGAGAPTYAQDMSVPYIQNVKAFSREYSFVLVTVNGNKVKADVYNNIGEIIDSFVAK